MIPTRALARMGLIILAEPVTCAVANTVRSACAGLRCYHEISIEVLNLIEPRG